MQAIVTKYLPPSNIRGSRVKATCQRGSITVSLPPELNRNDYHAYAANKLVDKFIKEDAERYGSNKNPWANPRITGELPNGDYVHVYKE